MAVLMGEYGDHFKMKNGNGTQCHLINVKPQRGEDTTACRATPFPHSCPWNEGSFKCAGFPSVTHLSHRDDGAFSHGGVSRSLPLLGRCLTTPSISVTQYYRQHLPKEPSSPAGPLLPSVTKDEIPLEKPAATLWLTPPSLDYEL